MKSFFSVPVKFEMYVFAVTKNITKIHISRCYTSIINFKKVPSAVLRQVEIAEAQALPWQHTHFLAHLSRRLVGELIVYPWSGVRPSASHVRRPSSSSTISNMNISATSWPISMKFYHKHHWDGGKAALGFGPDLIQTLVSMATNSSHRVIMEKTVLPLFLSCFSSDPFYTCR